MLPHVAARAKRYEIIEGVVAELAPFDLVMDLKIFQAPALLAPPLVPLQDSLHQPAVNLLPQLDPFHFLQHLWDAPSDLSTLCPSNSA